MFGLKRAKAGEVHTLAVMDASGDRKVEWNTEDPAALAQAREVFADIQRKGGSVFYAQPSGEGGGRAKEFDPRADMIGVPKIVGG